MKIAIAIIVIILVIAGVYLLVVRKPQTPVANPATAGGTSAPLETPNTAAAGAATSAPSTVTVTYTGSAFSPATVTIHQGDTVRFVDATGQGMWVASNPHPIHNGYSGTTVDQHCPDTAGTAFDQCSVGTSYTFTFQKVGSWGYHNHLNHGVTGTIVVTP